MYNRNWQKVFLYIGWHTRINRIIERLPRNVYALIVELKDEDDKFFQCIDSLNYGEFELLFQ